jgi:beta-lactamase class A
MRDEHPNGDFEISVAKLIEYAITVSDNNACDLLFDLIGGTAALEQFLEDKNIENMSIKANEVEKSKGFEVQYKNNCTPYVCTELLDGLFHNMVVSTESSAFLYKTMVATTTGANRIRGKLSKNVTVAHKTGSGDTNKEGMTAAINDVGIVTLQNGEHVAISVLVTDSYETMETSELIIAKIAKEVVKFYEN